MTNHPADPDQTLAREIAVALSTAITLLVQHAVRSKLLMTAEPSPVAEPTADKNVSRPLPNALLPGQLDWNDPSVFLKTDDAAKRLGVAARTLIDWRTKGLGPRFRKHGRCVVYQLRDVIAWSESRQANSTSQRLSSPSARR